MRQGKVAINERKFLEKRSRKGRKKKKKEKKIVRDFSFYWNRKLETTTCVIIIRRKEDWKDTSARVFDPKPARSRRWHDACACMCMCGTTRRQAYLNYLPLWLLQKKKKKRRHHKKKIDNNQNTVLVVIREEKICIHNLYGNACVHLFTLCWLCTISVPLFPLLWPVL